MQLSRRCCVIFAPILIASSLFAQGLQAPLTVSVTSATNSSVQLSWIAPPSGAPAIVERKTLNGSYAPLPTIPEAGISGNTIVHKTIDAFTTHVYRGPSASAGRL